MSGRYEKVVICMGICKIFKIFKIARAITAIGTRLEILAAYCPSDFAKRPKSLNACAKYKATKFRQFLLYTGPVVTYGILKDIQEVYTHFLLLHVAIRILISASPSEAYLNFADYALQKFVIRSEHLYGPIFTSYNI